MAATENAEGREPDRTIHLDGREKDQYMALIREDPGARKYPPDMVSLNDLRLVPPVPNDQIIAAVNALAHAEKAHDDALVAKQAAEHAVDEAIDKVNAAQRELRHLRRLLVRS